MLRSSHSVATGVGDRAYVSETHVPTMKCSSTYYLQCNSKHKQAHTAHLPTAPLEKNRVFVLGFVAVHGQHAMLRHAVRVCGFHNIVPAHRAIHLESAGFGLIRQKKKRSKPFDGRMLRYEYCDIIPIYDLSLWYHISHGVYRVLGLIEFVTHNQCKTAVRGFRGCPLNQWTAW